MFSRQSDITQLENSFQVSPGRGPKFAIENKNSGSFSRYSRLPEKKDDERFGARGDGKLSTLAIRPGKQFGWAGDGVRMTIPSGSGGGLRWANCTIVSHPVF